MTRESRDLLDSQLQEALAEIQLGEGLPFEVAVLAGLLSRLVETGYGTEPVKLDSLLIARSLRDQAKLTDSFPADEEVVALLDRLFALTDEADVDERADLLLELDELGAASTFLSEPDRYRPVIAEAAGMVRAYPDLFRPLAPSASRVIADSAFGPLDPSLDLWQALEASRFEEAPMEPPACDAARAKLGLRPIVSLGAASHFSPGLYAANKLPKALPVTHIGQGTQFELGLGRAPDGEMRILLQLQTSATLLRNRQAVVLDQLAPNFYQAPAFVGEYQLVIGDDTFEFELAD